MPSSVHVIHGHILIYETWIFCHKAPCERRLSSIILQSNFDCQANLSIQHCNVSVCKAESWDMKKLRGSWIIFMGTWCWVFSVSSTLVVCILLNHAKGTATVKNSCLFMSWMFSQFTAWTNFQQWAFKEHYCLFHLTYNSTRYARCSLTSLGEKFLLYTYSYCNFFNLLASVTF